MWVKSKDAEKKNESQGKGSLHIEMLQIKVMVWMMTGSTKKIT